MDKIEQLVMTVIKSFVHSPEDVELHSSQETDDKGELTMINVKVNRDDVGLCIGEKGATAEAVRRIVGLAGFKETGKRVFVRIDAPKLAKNHFEV